MPHAHLDNANLKEFQSRLVGRTHGLIGLFALCVSAVAAKKAPAKTQEDRDLEELMAFAS